MRGFEPPIFCSQSRRLTKLGYILLAPRPNGVAVCANDFALLNLCDQAFKWHIEPDLPDAEFLQTGVEVVEMHRWRRVLDPAVCTWFCFTVLNENPVSFSFDGLASSASIIVFDFVSSIMLSAVLALTVLAPCVRLPVRPN